MGFRRLCPQCLGSLKYVSQSSGSSLNSDQFDSVKAGDYYCTSCPSNGRGQASFCYWWTRETIDEQALEESSGPDLWKFFSREENR